MLRKLLFKTQDRKQLIIALTGAFLALTFLVTALHYFIRLTQFGATAEMLNTNTIIVQKKVGNSSTLMLTKMDFSQREIERLKNEHYIQDVQPIISNNFDVEIETSDPAVPRFRSDVFIQTVDARFLDVTSEKWNWKRNDPLVPIILPRDFLVMLNTFMSSSGIPPISEDLAKDIQFKLRLKNGVKTTYIDAKIIGFTNEVSAILVPEAFMAFGNREFNSGNSPKITQLMLSSKKNKFGLVEELLYRKGLEAKNAQLMVGRLKSVAGTLLVIIMGMAVVALFTAGLVFVQYLQLLLSRNSYEIQTLLRIGYYENAIVMCFFTYFVQLFALLSIASLATFFWLKHLLDELLTTGGVPMDTHVSVVVIASLIGVFIVFCFASFWTARRGVATLF